VFFSWHPNDYEFLFRQDNAADEGLWLVDARTGQHRLIAQPPTYDVSGAAISPDGQHLIYATNSFNAHQIWAANADGSEPHLLLESKMIVAVWRWAPDSRYIVYIGEPSSNGSLWVMDHTGQMRKPLKGAFLFGYGFEPTWSPDGQQITYVGRDHLDLCWQKDATFRADPLCWFKGTAIYIENVDTGDLRRIATNAIDPAWSPDGSMLAFSALDTIQQQVDIWVINTNGTNLRQLTNTSEIDRYPIWLRQ
jgi:TolB protein